MFAWHTLKWIPIFVLKDIIKQIFLNHLTKTTYDCGSSAIIGTAPKNNRRHIEACWLAQNTCFLLSFVRSTSICKKKQVCQDWKSERVIDYDFISCLQLPWNWRHIHWKIRKRPWSKNQNKKIFFEIYTDIHWFWQQNWNTRL